MAKTTSILLFLLLFGKSQLIAQSTASADKTRPAALTSATLADARHGKVITEKLASVILRENRVGLDTERNIKIYLPPGYESSGKAYPVVYYCHNIFWNAEKVFQDGKLVNLLEKGFDRGVVNELIFVVADYSTTLTGSLYENSPVSGKWLDFTTQELVPFIDKRFRTLPHRDSRALAGDFIGGRGALKLAMTRADIFGSVYAMHPVAVGMGHLPWSGVGIDWKKIHQAKTFDDLAGNGRDQIFLRVCQAFLPNLSRPPFYCDFFADMENGELKFNIQNIITAKAGFHLEETLNESASNLRSLRGIAFDWGRFDPNQDHVYANQAFSKKLEDLGVEHEAEEYRGDPFNRNWTENGRFYTRMLPFFARNLTF